VYTVFQCQCAVDILIAGHQLTQRNITFFQFHPGIGATSIIYPKATKNLMHGIRQWKTWTKQLPFTSDTWTRKN